MPHATVHPRAAVQIKPNTRIRYDRRSVASRSGALRDCRSGRDGIMGYGLFGRHGSKARAVGRRPASYNPGALWSGAGSTYERSVAGRWGWAGGWAVVLEA